MNLLRVLVCGDDGSGKTTLAARLDEASERDRRHVTVVGTVDSVQHTRSLASEAVASDAALVVVDARAGLTGDTQKQLHLLAALGLGRIALAVNKMDLVGYDDAVFGAVERECSAVAARLGASVACLPVSAADGDNIDHRTVRMPWYFGPSLVACLEPDGREAARSGVPGLESADQFEATIVWTADRPMLQSRSYLMRAGTETVPATVAPIKYRVDSLSLQRFPAKALDCGEVGVCNLQLGRPIAFGNSLRRFILLDRLDNEAVGAGVLHFALRRSHNVRWQMLDVDKDARAALMGQKPCVIWFTGLSGAGKSTIANLVEKRLHALGRHTYLLDGDNVRHGLNRDLGFTDTDRVENIRRIAEVARLMVDAGLMVLVSFISPFRSERRMARALVGEKEFVEVFVDTPLEVAESRDPKGLYQKARRGELKNFTGVDSPYEVPEHPELRLDTTGLTAEESAEAILEHLRGGHVIASARQV
jgi:adenylyl-sulfate kinase